MAKMYKKSKLTFKDSFIVTKKGKIVAIDNEVVDLMNTLEERLQRAIFIDDQPEACAGPDLSKFERIHAGVNVSVKHETPTLDQKVEESMLLMQEIDDSNSVTMLNMDLEGMRPLLEFIGSDTVISVEHSTPHRFDTPRLGNPLELTIEDVIEAEMIIHDITHLTSEQVNPAEDDGQE